MKARWREEEEEGDREINETIILNNNNLMLRM